MKRNFWFLTIVSGSLFFIGCAHYHTVQSKAEKVEAAEGFRVSIGSSEVKIGDHVDVIKRTCVTRNISIRHSPQTCTKKKMGEATVTQVLGPDAAIVVPQGELAMEEGMFIEKDGR